MDVRQAAYVSSALGGSEWKCWMQQARNAWQTLCIEHGEEPRRWVESGWKWTEPSDAHVTLMYDLFGRDLSSAVVAMACVALGPLPALSVVRTHWWTRESQVPAVWVAELDLQPWQPWLDELHRQGWRHHREVWTPHITLGKADSFTPAAQRARAMAERLGSVDVLPEWNGRSIGPWEPLTTHVRRPSRQR